MNRKEKKMLEASMGFKLDKVQYCENMLHPE